MKRDDLFEGLSEQQKEAICYVEGPLLVLAGAGSGKTKVITHKLLYLEREEGLPAEGILTVTLTNRAASEIRHTVAEFMNGPEHNYPIGTPRWHCLQILRREITALGYGTDFVIYDDDDREALIRHILREFNIYEALYKGVASRLGYLKASLVWPEEFVSTGDGFGFDEKLAKVYVRYQDELKRCNAVDCDDLVMLTVRLFREFPEILEQYKERYQYILVDDFHDLSPAEYEFLRLLFANRNFTVTADDDQCIMKFKGGESRNIYKLEEDFPEVRVLPLEKNFRSTQNIVKVFGSVISRNTSRKDKRIRPLREKGEKVFFYWLPTEEDEAKYVVKNIREVYLRGEYSYGDMAILYRIPSQSRTIEEALKREKIPYRVIGGENFYERKEIRDLIAYLKLIQNPHDNVSLRRVINLPSRGIGIQTLTKLEQESKVKGTSLYETIKEVCSKRGSNQPIVERLRSFVKLIEALRKRAGDPVSEILKSIMELSGYGLNLSEEKLQYIGELMASTEETGLEEFLEKVSLMSSYDDVCEKDSVSLMTIPMSRGLEFPVVFIIGLEEGLIPYFKTLEDEEGISDERRLFYLGMTRAKDILFLTGAKKRRVLSRLQEQEPSRFLKDIPRQYCAWIEKSPCHIPASLGDGKKPKTFRVATVYKTGCRVRHPKWGIGVIRECYGEGDEMKVCVNFPKVGLKRLAIKYAQLERL